MRGIWKVPLLVGSSLSLLLLLLVLVAPSTAANKGTRAHAKAVAGFGTSSENEGNNYKRQQRFEYSISDDGQCKKVHIRNGNCVYENGIVHDERLGKKHEANADQEALVKHFLEALENKQHTSPLKWNEDNPICHFPLRLKRLHRGFGPKIFADKDWEKEMDDWEKEMDEMDRVFDEEWEKREKEEKNAMAAVPCLCAPESCDSSST